MNTHTIGRAMIETAVKHGYKEMKEDPRRSMRQLADLGKQFSRSRFQDDIFSVIQESLSNEDSAYYSMIENAMNNMDETAMETFGINVGYNSWCYGARLVRAAEIRTRHMIPLIIHLRYENGSTGLTIDALEKLIREGQEMGIFLYNIRETGSGSDSYELFDLFARFPECAFLYSRPTGRLTAAQIQILKMLKNTLLLLPIEDPETLLTAQLLRDQKTTWSVTYSYSSLESFESGAEDALRRAVSIGSFFVMPLANDDASEAEIEKTAKCCYRTRLEQKYPCMIIDYYGDCAALMRKVVNHRDLLEIGADGKVLRPTGAGGKLFPFGQSLSAALSEIMPEIDTSDISEI